MIENQQKQLKVSEGKEFDKRNEIYDKGLEIIQGLEMYKDLHWGNESIEERKEILKEMRIRAEAQKRADEAADTTRSFPSGSLKI